MSELIGGYGELIKKDFFPVKSVYHVARNRVLNGDHVNPSSSKALWTSIWNASIPSKVKICAWKACANILLSCSRLSERGVNLDTSCPMCDEVVETLKYALRDCTVATEALHILSLPMAISANPSSEIHSWLLHQVSVLSKTDFAKLLMIIWSIWCNRNARIWGDVYKSSSDFVPVTLAYWAEYRVVHVSSNIHSI